MVMLGTKIAPFFPMPFIPYKVIQGVGEEFGDRYHPDYVLPILDEHNNNVKALDTLNQELFQLWMGEKETVSDWEGACWDTFRFSWHHSQNISPRPHSQAEASSFLWWTP